MDYSKICVLLVDGGDRQILPFAKALKKLGCKVATLNGSRLDLGFVSKYPDEKILDKSIQHDKKAHIAAIRKCIESKRYQLVVPTTDDTAEALSLMKDEYRDIVRITIPAPDLFYMAYDKNKLMKVCMDNKIPCPNTFFDITDVGSLLEKDFHYPIVVKPRKGFGAIGFHKVDDESQLKSLLENIKDDIPSYVFQEYIPQTDLQYKCAIFIDNSNEITSACVYAKNRWFPIDGGSSTCNVTVDRPDIIEICSKLLKTIGWRGAADIDLIQDPRDGIAKVMDFNPRISGSVKIAFEAGVDIAQQMLQLAFDEPVTRFPTYEKDVCLRCIHTDILWFLKSGNRFKTSPSWFSWKKTTDQIWFWKDPLPFVTFSIQAILKYKREMKKRAR